MSFGELQNLLLAQIERDHANFKKTVKESRRTSNYLSSRLSMLEGNFATAKRYHEEIMSGKLEKGMSKDDLIVVYEKIQDSYLDYRSDLLDAIDRRSQEQKDDAVAKSTELRLPKINIPEFSGSYSKWRSFHDIFVSLIHDNKSISDIQKMHYLKSGLTGEAARLLQHMSIDAGNYDKSWELLTARFDHKRVLVNAQLKLFFGQLALVKESAQGIKSLLDVSSECLHALENLELPVKHWDSIVIFILFQKLPIITQQLWEEKLGSNKDLPKWQQFTEFLESRFRTLEAVAEQGTSRLNAKPWSKSEVAPKVFHAKTQSKQFTCKLCHQGQHSLRKCNRFLGMDVTHRIQTVRQIKVCENCLAYSHFSRECPSRKSCYFCHQRHHTLLHFLTNTHTNTPHTYLVPQTQHTTENTPQQVAVNPNAPVFHPASGEQQNTNTRNAFYASQRADTNILLATAVVKVQSVDGRFFELRALIDSGSEATFISESAAQLLRLKKRRTYIEISGLGKVSNGTSQSYVDITYMSRDSAFKSSVRAYVFKSLTGLLPARPVLLDSWNHISGLQLADPSFHVPATIDLLFGTDVYSEVILPEIIRSAEVEAPIAQKTQLGWVLLGKVPEIPRRLQSFVQLVDLDVQMRNFWEIEEAPFPIQQSEEEIECERHFTTHTRRLSDGRYEVSLPFKGGKRPALAHTREIALKRFAYLERRLQKDEKLRIEYSRCIMEYFTMNHMEEIDLENDAILKSPYHSFLPHHAVVKESSSTTKVRVVFDAASKSTDGTSLNDHLMVGPKLQSDIIKVLLRWRKYEYTFTADVEKMYRQIWVNSADRNYQIILWRLGVGEPIRGFKLKTVTFGTASAPFLAIRTTRQVADDEAYRFPIGAAVIKEEMYVDDLLSGAESVEEARQKRNEVRKILDSAGLKLRKWTSNHKELISDIPEQDRESNFELPLGYSEHVKTLGIRWFPGTDSFSFQNFSTDGEEITKRSVLSSIAKLFDPLGWIAPCTIKAKILMQQLWKRGRDWDQPIPEDLKREWEIFRSELPLIQHIMIPRWIGTRSCYSVELHGFCDASMKAYGAAVYLRVVDNDRQIRMSLLLSKTRVAPISTVNLPRLELCGAVLLATLLEHVKAALGMPLVRVYAWSDSAITLAWIRGPPSKWTIFVANRVAEIQRLTNINDWRHIPTEHNPADLASRGVAPSTLGSQDMWWRGPAFLRNHWQFQEPKQPDNFDTEEEVKKIKSHHVTTLDTNEILKVIQKFSTLSKVVRVLAYCLRFLQNCKAESKSKQTGVLKVEELQSATQLAIRTAQRSMFSAELEELEGKNTIPKALKSLNAYLDGHGIIRVGGRLQNSLLAYNQQHPAILKSSHHFADLVIRDAHQQSLHGGIQQMVSYIRTAYWITNIKRSVKKHIHQCVVCFRHKAHHMQQLMRSLPAPRVRMARPFSNTGVDYAGPIEIKTWKGRGAKCLKGYFAIFVCLSTKAIHLEAVSELSTQAFVAAFRRFTARRGICSQLYSDCGTNFVGADAELKRMMENAKHDWKEIAEILSRQGTTWNFIPPASPHFGGLWEAGVKSVKHHLKRVVKDERLTFEELCTLLTQVEACLNSRPLAPLSDNPDDLEILTPGHFLIGEAIHTIPQGDTSTGKVSYIDRWKRIQTAAETFWRKWSGEYLSRLQQRPKWQKIEVNPRVGDLVIVRDERLPPAQWMLARILEVHPGTDKLIRVVTLKTKTGKLKRPITKICYLPSNKSSSEDTLV